MMISKERDSQNGMRNRGEEAENPRSINESQQYKGPQRNRKLQPSPSTTPLRPPTRTGDAPLFYSNTYTSR
jgi:hypothetical protein